MVKFTVIVPAFNSERYLPQCIESILSQTCNDFELIIVDDGSIDNTPTICDYYAKVDRRVSVVHQKNQGVSVARNTGLSNAHGKYIVFCDSDDMFEHCFLEHLEQNEFVDLIINGYTIIGENNDFFQHKYKKQHINGIDATTVEGLIDSRCIDYIWGKRFNRQIICDNSVAFNERVNIAEDTLFTANYLRYCKTVTVTEYTDYFYRKSDGISLSAYTDDYFKRNLIANKEIEAVLSLIDPAIAKKDAWKRRIWMTCYFCIISILRNTRDSYCCKLQKINRIYTSGAYRNIRKDVWSYSSGDGIALRTAFISGSPLFTLFLWELIKKVHNFLNGLKRRRITERHY